MRTGRRFLSLLVLACSIVPSVSLFGFVNAAGSGLEIDSFQVGSLTGGDSSQRFLNVSIEIGNAGGVAQNFTIKLFWDNSSVATLNVTNFAPGARQWFNLRQWVTFDPTKGHVVGVSAGDAWEATPVYRPPWYGTASTNTPLWNGDAAHTTVLIVVFVLVISLIGFLIIRRSKNQNAPSLDF